MKILYLSCHEILEYDELRLLGDLGHECFSLGAYTHPTGDAGRKRPGLPSMPYDAHFIELSLQCDRARLLPELVAGFDVAIVMHKFEWIADNWSIFQAAAVPVIWRSIGQSTSQLEHWLAAFRPQGLRVVRYSPREATIAGYAGADATIRFAKYPADFAPWNGDSGRVVNFTQSMRQRGSWVGYQWLHDVTEGLPRRFYGPGNEDLADSGGLLGYLAMLDALAEAGAYIWHGTWPASYTLTLMEAMLAGVPTVVAGARTGRCPLFPDQDQYEGHEIIEDGVSGFVADDVDDARSRLVDLLTDRPLAEKISAGARARGIELFDAAHIAPQWQALLESL